ncbi:MAG: DUF1990 domain-containing protein [Actinobacteria bacterium]|nr:DUF1990 domain-containing protein [Actinomycetota bacterium]
MTSAVLDERLAATTRAQRALAGLADRPLNFDPDELRGAEGDGGWNVDDYQTALPAEPPGDPLPGGSFAIAQRLMCDYAFADPAMVRAVYDPASELADRNMLLQVRFGPVRLFCGCRVSRVVDETRRIDGHRVRVWGWSYGTLAGHVERGQMDYAVWKWLDDGAVDSHPRGLEPGAGAQPDHRPGVSARRPRTAGALRAARLRADGRPRRARAGARRLSAGGLGRRGAAAS